MTRVSTHRSSRLQTAIASASLSILLVASLVMPVQPAQAQTYGVVVNFGVGTLADVSFPNGDMVQDSDGNLYGTTARGGSGVVFKLDTSSVVTVLYSFTCGDDGCHPETGLFRDPEGNLYGTTSTGAAAPGTIFKLGTNHTLTTLHKFSRGDADGAGPDSKLVSVNGELYGTTSEGGGSGCTESLGCGAIFKITKDGLENVVYRFTGGADGAAPQSLVRDADGNLYGVASSGGSLACLGGCGTIFKVNTSGTFSVLYTFGGIPDGSNPVGRLTVSANGDITGATRFGGSPCNCGTVFRLKPNGDENIVHNFFGGKSGASPAAGIVDLGGVLYGTTSGGGDLACHVTSVSGCGVLFQIGKTGEYTVLHRFAGAPEDGAFPTFGGFGGLTVGSDGAVYGATAKGGSGTNCDQNPGCGTIFKYTP